jgi:hypothetical protein
MSSPLFGTGTTKVGIESLSRTRRAESVPASGRWNWKRAASSSSHTARQHGRLDSPPRGLFLVQGLERRRIQFALFFPRTLLLAVSGCPVAFSICLFAAFVSALFGCSIPSLTLEMIDPCFRVDPNNRIVRAMLLCLLLRVEARCWIQID